MAGLPAVLAAIWHEALGYRAAIHRSRPTRCDLRVTLPGADLAGTGAIRLDGDCPCRDFLVDMLVECHRHLVHRSGDLRNPMGAVRVHLRLRAAPDWIRRRRTEMGAQVRTDRIRSGARARGLPDDFHRALLEYLVDEAGSMAPLDNQDALLRRLATRCCDEFGGAPAHYLDQVAAGVEVIERHCRSGPRVNAGTAEHPEHVTWWERYVERPLGRRPRRTDRPIPAVEEQPGAEAGPSAATGVEPFAPGPAGSSADDSDAVVLAVLAAALRRHPDAPAAALRAGLGDLVGHGLLTEGSAAALLADHARFALATRELSALG